MKQGWGEQVLTREERRDWLRLSRTPNIGPVTFFKLLRKFGTIGAVLDVLPDLQTSAGKARNLTPFPMEKAEEELQKIEALGAHLVAACEPNFPPLLQHLNPPPPLLTYLGDITLAAKPCVAIVGSRNASAIGLRMARDLAQDLGAAGYTIVSGLARGVDGAAHAASLATGTVATIAGGIDHIFPPQHSELYQAIATQGLIVTERTFGTVARAKDFPRRNRIITGISAGVIVVEAAERSGSLVSARMAGEQGREVMAVPGSPLDERARGTNKLIREGATLIRGADDVIQSISSMTNYPQAAEGHTLFEPERAEFEHISEDELSLLKAALSIYPVAIWELASIVNVSERRCLTLLMELELAGDAITHPGGSASLPI